MRDGGDKTQMSLIFANQTEQDILLRDELEALERDNDNFKLHYTVDRPPAKGVEVRLRLRHRGDDQEAHAPAG